MCGGMRHRTVRHSWKCFGVTVAPATSLRTLPELLPSAYLSMLLLERLLDSGACKPDIWLPILLQCTP